MRRGGAPAFVKKGLHGVYLMLECGALLELTCMSLCLYKKEDSHPVCYSMHTSFELDRSYEGRTGNVKPCMQINRSQLFA